MGRLATAFTQGESGSADMDLAGNAIIVTGMHRSGTSLVAQALAWAGLYLGDRLKGPSRFNPEGYFEDLDVVSFHDQLLAVNGAKWELCQTLQHLQLPGDSEAVASALLEAKFGGRTVWGWKDPRTTLFLSFWNRLLPDAHWILVMRRPGETVFSLQRRGDMRQHARNPVKRAQMALQLWMHYNRCILGFARAYPQRVLLVVAPDDFAPLGQDLANLVITERWRLGLQPLDFGSVYLPKLMKTRVPGWISGLVTASRTASALFRELCQLREELSAAYMDHQAPLSSARLSATKALPVKRKVCIVAPREFAYSETFVRDHICHLPADVHVLYGGSPRADPNASSGVSGSGLLEISLADGAFPNRSGDGRGLVSHPARGVDLMLWYFFNMSSQPFSRRALRTYLVAERTEAVLAEFGQTGAQVMSACASADVPLVVHFHGYDVYQQRLVDRYLPLYQRLFRNAGAIVAVSREMVEALAALGAPRAKLFYNPCGVDTRRFAGANPAAAPPVFLAAGRFVEKKAPHLTVLAFKQVHEACPEARLQMIGDGPLLELCQQLTAVLHIESQVSFQGVRSRLEVALAMRTARAFVQHSVRSQDGDAEGTPVTILEAAASGLPVISTLHGGIKDAVVDGQTGFLVAEGDIDVMAQHMIELVRNPSLAAALGQRGREHVMANYSLDKRIAALAEIIELAINEHQK
jgi:colanic acid/amylovoran biosynthesis glycosyltransferase